LKEARRIRTPKNSDSPSDGHPQGFFDITTPGDKHTSAKTPLRYFFRDRASISACIENDKSDPGNNQEPISFVSTKGFPATVFVLDVPDHLSNSPLCPINPMHQSGSTGICPMHGRRKMVEKEV
jgi:parafibromin